MTVMFVFYSKQGRTFVVKLSDSFSGDHHEQVQNKVIPAQRGFIGRANCRIQGSVCSFR